MLFAMSDLAAYSGTREHRAAALVGANVYRASRSLSAEASSAILRTGGKQRRPAQRPFFCLLAFRF